MGILVVALWLVGIQQAGAVEVLDLVLQQENNVLTPVFMDGHEGDPNWIGGFSFVSDITLNGVKIGTYSGSLDLRDKPMVLTRMFDTYDSQGSIEFTGIGTCALAGSGIGMLASAQGDMLVSFAGKMDACTGGLAGIAAIINGRGQASLTSSSGTIAITLSVPLP
jgi:hypothetical protein